MESLMKMVDAYKPSKVVLAPFMIVAGDHAKNDMAGDDPESWYSQFKAQGYCWLESRHPQTSGGTSGGY